MCSLQDLIQSYNEAENHLTSNTFDIICLEISLYLSGGKGLMLKTYFPYTLHIIMVYS